MTAVAPSIDELDRLAQHAWAELPSAIRELAGDVLIRVEEVASDEVLDDLGIVGRLVAADELKGPGSIKKSAPAIRREAGIGYIAIASQLPCKPRCARVCRLRPR